MYVYEKNKIKYTHRVVEYKMLSGWRQEKNMLKNKLQVGDQNESEANVYTSTNSITIWSLEF